MNQPPGLPHPAGGGGSGGNVPPGLSGAVSPPPGFNGPNMSSLSGGSNAQGAGSVSTIVKAQIVFLLSTLSEESFERNSAEIRALAAQHGPEMYHHFLRRLLVVASPILQSLQSQSSSLAQPAPPPGLGGPVSGQAVTGSAAFTVAGDRPLRSGLVVPSNGAGVLAWRLLESEGRRACRDPTLAPHFALTLLHPIPPSQSPLLQLNLLSIPSAYLFSFASHLLSPHARSSTLIPAYHPLRERASGIMRGLFDEIISSLRQPNVPWWGEGQGDLGIQEGRGLIFSIYPVMPEDGNTSSIWSKSAPQNKNLVLPLNSQQRELLLQSLSIKFASPALILQSLPSLSPGGGLVPLASILFELGDGLTSDEGVVRDVVGRWLGGLIASRGGKKEDWEKEEGEEDDEGRELELEIAGCVKGIGEGLLEGRGVDLVGVIRGIDAIGGLDWSHIIKTFDLPSSILSQALTSLPIRSLVVSLVSTPLATPQATHAPIDGLLSGPWTNSLTLIKVLSALLSISPEQFSISSLPTMREARILKEEFLGELGMIEGARALLASSWNCQKVLDILAGVSRNAAGTGREEEGLVVECLQQGMREYGELVLMGLVKAQKPWSEHHAAMVKALIPAYFDGSNPISPIIYTMVGQGEPDMLLDALSNYYAESEMNIGRIVDVGQYGNLLERLLNLQGETMQMALDVAAFASKKELLNLESWVTDSINTYGEGYIHAVLDFLDHKIHIEGNRDDEVAETAPISPSIYATFFRALRATESLSPDDINQFKEIRNLCLQVHPRLMNLGPHSDVEPGLAVVSFPAEVDARVDDFYRRMYDEEITLDYVMEVFKNLKGSEAIEDHELFACMLHTLFDEYKFVKDYPTRQLGITGLLFGSIIQNRLLEGTPLHVAVKFVLDALESPPDSTMFEFGKNALHIFQSRLPEFPSMCKAILQIPYLHDTNPLLISIIRTALTDRDPEGDSGSHAGSIQELEPVVFTALQVEELESDGDAVLDPEEEISDKILFIINNLAINNFDSKIEEMRSRFDARYSRWFANYLVNSRVSVEPNNHQLYAQLLEGLHTPALEKHVLWETYKKSLSLLNQEKTVTDTQDRATLKNLGSWLGRLTLAKDLPIRHKNLSVKDLLLQGYDAKRLIVALPYICKIMEQCAFSRVFHPPNPWLMAVMRFLAELYNFGDLKLTLKFEIEVLCKSLNMSLDDLEPTTILRSRTPPTAPAQPQGGLAQELDRITLPAGGYLGAGQRSASSLNPGMPSEASQAAMQDAFLRRVEELIGSLPEFLIFSSAYPLFQTTPALKRIVHHSIDRSVREIIHPVVERSVTIASISSRDLLVKDFGMERDENKLRQAAHLMVQKLAGSLALVTCKEPLRTSMTTNIRNTMLTSGFSDENMPDQAIAGVVQDNLDLACSIIKNAAKEKAVKEIDSNLSQTYETRRQHREAGQMFWDPSPFTTTVSQSALPESLRLLQHGLQPLQLRVYEDFGDQSRFALQAGAPGMVDSDYPPLPSVHNTSGMHDGTVDARAMQQRGPMGAYGRPDGTGMMMGETLESSIMGAKLTVAQSMEKFQDLISEMNRILARLPPDDLVALSMNHDIKLIIRQFPVIATQSVNTDQTALAFSQKVVQFLYKSDALLSRDVYVTILQRLCDLFPKVAKEVTEWLIYAEDIRKFNVPVTIALIRAGLINVPEQDMQMAKIISRDYAPPAMDFTADLIRECLLGETPCASRNQLANSLDALLRASSQRRATSTVERLLEDMQARTGLRSAPLSEISAPHGGVSPQPAGAVVIGRQATTQASIMQQPIDPELRHTLTIYFLEWVRLFTSPLPVEASFVPFVNRLQKQGILKGEEVSSAFYRNSIALAIDIYSKHKVSGSPQMFHGVDALSKLIALLLKNYSDTHGVSSDSAKQLYFAKIFTIAALSLVRDHEEHGAAFEQRPYYRFFSSLLSDLQGIQSSFPSAYYGCLRTFANHLGSIQPSIVPGFAFSWMALMSHRFFMPRLLQVANKEGWADFYRVLMALFKFLNPFLQAAEMHHPSRILFKGALRVMLVILKDFPEFLVEHYIGLCAAIPPHCIQLRNVVLCAFPRGVVVRQDYTTLSQLLPGAPDFQVVPEVRTDYVRFLEDADIKKAVDQYIHRDSPSLAALLPEVRNRIAISVSSADGTPGVTYNLTLLYSLTLYLGAVAVDRSIEKNGQVVFDSAAPEVALLSGLVSSLDGEGQYNFINSVANQLRYPNAHTFFFMHYLLHLFATAPNGTDLAERITRVLLERVLAQRPYPAGLTLTMSTLLREPRYNFFGHSWARPENQPELFSLFQRVALR